jgi:hypothetical protein
MQSMPRSTTSWLGSSCRMTLLSIAIRWASCRFGTRSSDLSYAGLAILRALYCGTMVALQIPGDRLVRTLSCGADFA